MHRSTRAVLVSVLCLASTSCGGGAGEEPSVPAAVAPAGVVDATGDAVVRLDEYLGDAAWPGQEQSPPPVVEIPLYEQDFESPDALDGWTITEIQGRLQFWRSADVAHAGRHSLAVASLGGMAQGYVTTVVPVRGEGSLHIRAELHCGSMQVYNAGFTCGLLVGEFAEEPRAGLRPTVKRPLGAEDPDTPGDWRSIDLILEPAPSTRYIQIDAPLAAWGQATGTVFVDDLAVTTIPPAEVAFPHLSRAEASTETRSGVLVPEGSSITWRVRPGPATSLRVAATATGTGSAVAAATVRAGEDGPVEEPLRWELGAVGNPRDRTWMEGTVDLGAHAGGTIDLTLSAEGGPILWAGPRLLPAPEGPRRGVVLVSVDTLRADHLGCYGYDRPTSPFIDTLAARGVRFTEARTHASWTLPSHVSMLTGRSPLDHGVDNFGDSLGPEMETVASRLRGHGVQTLASTTHVFVSPAFGVDRGFDRLVYVQDPPPEQAVDAALALLETADERPFFLFVHLFTPHWDYAPPEEYRARFAAGYRGTLTGSWADLRHFDFPTAPMPPRDLAHVISLYDAEIRYTDDAIRSLWEGLERMGLAGTTTLLFTSDHGEEFKDHGELGHGKTLFEEQLRAPLLITGAGVAAPATVDVPVQHVDLLPTICALAGVPAPDGLAGRNLLDRVEDPGEGRPHLAETKFNGPWRRSLVDGPFKLVVELSTGNVALFDLHGDPDEHRNLAADDPVRLAAMQRRLAELVSAEERRRERRSADDGTPLLTQSQEAHLRALGYIQ